MTHVQIATSSIYFVYDTHIQVDRDWSRSDSSTLLIGTNILGPRMTRNMPLSVLHYHLKFNLSLFLDSVLNFVLNLHREITTDTKVCCMT